MIFGKKYFEKVFKQEDPWRYFVCRYESRRYVREIEAVKQCLPHPRNILEIGCAEGAHTLMLARAFPRANILGVDISGTAVRRAKQNCKHCHNVTIIEADIVELLEKGHFPENTFDVIIQSESLYYLLPRLIIQLNLLRYVDSIIRIMKNDGIFVTSNQFSIRTKPAMGLYYLILKHVSRLMHNCEYRECHDIKCKYFTYDVKVFSKAR
ncbi:MAG: class I SAM-dependent methyltransferase [Dehalococcoidia bacterium]